MSNSINPMSLNFILNDNDTQLGDEQKKVSAKKTIPKHFTASNDTGHATGIANKRRKKAPQALVLSRAWENSPQNKHPKLENKLSKARTLFKIADCSDSSDRRLISLYNKGLNECVLQPESLNAAEISLALAEVSQLIFRAGDAQLATNLIKASIDIGLIHRAALKFNGDFANALEGALQLMEFATNSSNKCHTLEHVLR
jgi:hypothetical protein